MHIINNKTSRPSAPSDDVRYVLMPLIYLLMQLLKHFTAVFKPNSNFQRSSRFKAVEKWPLITTSQTSMEDIWSRSFS